MHISKQQRTLTFLSGVFVFFAVFLALQLAPKQGLAYMYSCPGGDGIIACGGPPPGCECSCPSKGGLWCLPGQGISCPSGGTCACVGDTNVQACEGYTGGSSSGSGSGSSSGANTTSASSGINSTSGSGTGGGNASGVGPTYAQEYLCNPYGSRAADAYSSGAGDCTISTTVGTTIDYKVCDPPIEHRDPIPDCDPIDDCSDPDDADCCVNVWYECLEADCSLTHDVTTGEPICQPTCTGCDYPCAGVCYGGRENCSRVSPELYNKCTETWQAEFIECLEGEGDAVENQCPPNWCRTIMIDEFSCCIPPQDGDVYADCLREVQYNPNNAN